MSKGWWCNGASTGIDDRYTATAVEGFWAKVEDKSQRTTLARERQLSEAEQQAFLRLPRIRPMNHENI